MNYKNAQVRLTINLEGRLGAIASNATSKEDRIKILEHKATPAAFVPSSTTPCSQSITLGTEFIEYACSEEACPRKFDKKIWKNLRKIRRIEMHLEELAEALGGKLADYKIIE